MWLRFARCVARSVIVVAGKFASILICGLAAELRNSQPQSVLRFCVFGGQGFFGFRRNWKFFAEIATFYVFTNKDTLLNSLHSILLVPEKRHKSASSEGRIGPNSRVGAPPDSSRLRGPPRNRRSSGKVFLRCCCAMPKHASYCLIAPQIDLTSLILSRT